MRWRWWMDNNNGANSAIVVGYKGLPVAFVFNVMCVTVWPALNRKAYILYLCDQAIECLCTDSLDCTVHER